MPLVLVPILLAVVVFGRLEHTRLVVDAAAAAGARQAAVVGGDAFSVRRADRDRADSDGGIDADRAIVVVEPAVAGWGEPIRVRVEIAEPGDHPVPGSWARAAQRRVRHPQRGDAVIRPREADPRGQVALYAVLLFPILMLVFALVLTVGTLEGAACPNCGRSSTWRR